MNVKLCWLPLLAWLVSVAAFAQDTLQTGGIRVIAAAGYAIGGQVYNDSFLYNPGFKFDAGIYHPVSPSIALGAGSGLVMLGNGERFVPVYASLNGFVKPQKPGTFLQLKGGYAMAWNNAYAPFPDYSFAGGFMMNAGLGHRFAVGHSSLMIALLYGHQSAAARYTASDGKRFREGLSFDWLSVELQFMFGQ